ncbi:unnamed protein product [Rotaria sordida]|uniref:Phytanoyl-CoA dioxygenase n=1 Tax=Rotaria sordida TaxID=392033 RepID=A0A818LMG2_9BILA|nr:unnamed protein product [Rotaria sordida]CAF0968036.1 unnamed protein product [Rotaria sordida]CAF1009732.1 unnamed protein product [Rotaria sordida]CAF1034931.1 unnamed protein product [Rotaria sordida]CAF1059225.1 unnamed protein product [Rotaria sordida]
MARADRPNKNDQLMELDRAGIKVDYRTKSPRFSCQDPETLADGLRHLERHGYTIISDVLDEIEINTAKNLIWQHLEGLKSPYKIKRGQIHTWNIWPGRHEAGIVEDFGSGNSQAQWFIRSVPAIKDIFAEIWLTRNLLCSMDGIGLFRPWHLNPQIQQRDIENKTNPWKTIGANWHVDQSPVTKPNRVCVQGIINLLPADETTGGLMVIPGSHNRFHELLSIWKKTGNNSKIPLYHEILQEGYGLLIHAQPGDLLLWDSRTVHCNTPSFVTPQPLNNGERTDLLRMVSYICMTPLAFAENPDELIDRRLNAFRYRLTTSHWPHEFQLMGGEISRGENSIQLTDYQRNLILGIDQ